MYYFYEGLAQNRLEIKSFSFS